MSPNAVNWSLALPEIALAVSGLVILVVGVLQRRGEGFFPCAMLTIASFIGCGFLVAL
ncbi:MAG: NADH-quinone oxidoreductase subunit N, partial [Acetobacter sp.]|nr:NADH-quinone oxidoreductase subunit N [Acetobacter sp.]